MIGYHKRNGEELRVQDCAEDEQAWTGDVNHMGTVDDKVPQNADR
jgi:hypothetical protein